MIEVFVLIGFSWYFSAWLISKKPTLSFLVLSFFTVLISTVILGFFFGAISATALGLENSFGIAVVTAVRGAFFGLVIGGWSLIKTYRKLRLK